MGILLARLAPPAILLALTTAIGWFVYPTAWSASFGNVVPDALRRIAWGEMLFVLYQLIRITKRWITVYRDVRAGKGWVVWSGPPFPEYFKYTVGVACAFIVLSFYSFNFFGVVVPRPGTEGQVWFIFILISVASLAACSRALDIMGVIDENIKQANKYL